MSYQDTQDPMSQGQDPAASSGTAEEGGYDTDPAFVSDGRKPVNRNAILFGGLIVVGMVLLYFTYRGGPKTAQADTQASSSGGQIEQFLDSGNIKLMQQTLKDTEKVVQQFRESKQQVPLSQLRANPFRLLPPKTDTGAVIDDTDEKLAKFKAKAQHELEVLHLQTVISGRHPACMINNTLYRVGQNVGMFKLEKVSKDGVILTASGMSWKLPIQN